MSDELKPALSAEEWKDGPYSDAIDGYLNWSVPVLDIRAGHHASTEDFIRAVIALANASLPDGAPCKITQSMVGDLRRIAQFTGTLDADMDILNAIADKLAAFLPPKP
jgi:hypothetical protein